MRSQHSKALREAATAHPTIRSRPRPATTRSWSHDPGWVEDAPRSDTASIRTTPDPATGVTVRQWYYSAHAEDWPTLIMFRREGGRLE